MKPINWNRKSWKKFNSLVRNISNANISYSAIKLERTHIIKC